MSENPKLSCNIDLIIIKVNKKELPEKEIKKAPKTFFHNHYCFDEYVGIDDWEFVLFEQCETHKQLKEREAFSQSRLKTFYPLGLTEKEEYLYYFSFCMRFKYSISF